MKFPSAINKHYWGQNTGGQKNITAKYNNTYESLPIEQEIGTDLQREEVVSRKISIDSY